MQGFRLQDPEVDDVVRAARDLEAGCIEPDMELTAEENVELLLRATRLLQLGLEVQFAEADNILSENNNLREDMRVSSVSWSQGITRHRMLTADVDRGLPKHPPVHQQMGIMNYCVGHSYMVVSSSFAALGDAQSSCPLAFIFSSSNAPACTLQVLEDRNRALDEEVGELRELRDHDGVSGDVRELETELKVRLIMQLWLTAYVLLPCS